MHGDSGAAAPNRVYPAAMSLGLAVASFWFDLQIAGYCLVIAGLILLVGILTRGYIRQRRCDKADHDFEASLNLGRRALATRYRQPLHRQRFWMVMEKDGLRITTTAPINGSGVQLASKEVAQDFIDWLAE